MRTAVVSPSLSALAASSNASPPFHLGTRYDRNGTFKPEPGNTVVSHLLPGEPETEAILRLRQRMLEMPRADLLGFTPASSLHMTLFQGIIEFRRKAGYWPSDMPLEAPIDAVTDRYLEKLEGFESRGAFRIKVDEVTPLGLTVSGYAEEDAVVLTAWRDALADVFGYRHPNHETYVFHITFAYILDWFPDEDISAVAAALQDFTREIQAAAPVIRLAPPAFCRFADMNHFEELLVFG